jgi:hypothetical protein
LLEWKVVLINEREALEEVAEVEVKAKVEAEVKAKAEEVDQTKNKEIKIPVNKTFITFVSMCILFQFEWINCWRNVISR